MSSTAPAAACSAKAEQRGLPLSVTRMMGLQTAAAILGGIDELAAALGITGRGTRYKIAGDRGVSDDELRAAADALDRRAAWIITHANKLRAEAAPADQPSPAGDIA